MVKKILEIIIGVAAILAILSIFGNPFQFLWWCLKWLWWCIDVLAMWMTRNPEINYLLSTTPGDLGLIMMILP